jgi:hypothetical protein
MITYQGISGIQLGIYTNIIHCTFLRKKLYVKTITKYRKEKCQGMLSGGEFRGKADNFRLP